MLVEKQVKVASHIDDLMSQLVTVVKSLKAGESPLSVAMAELLKFSQLIEDFKNIDDDFNESFSASLKAISLNAADLAAALLGKN